MMKVLFIGGTGIISTATSRLAVERGIDLYHFNRGTRKVEIPGVRTIIGDVHKAGDLAKALDGRSFDAVVNWIAFVTSDVERDIELLAGKTKQYVFISSASVYQTPPTHPVITESTPLANPVWQYSRDKLACEERLMKAYREQGFPVTIVRPSYTYDNFFPVAIGPGNWTTPGRMRRGAKVIAHGDGSSLWTLTHSEDFAKAFVGLLGNPQATGNSFHITSDEVLTWNQVLEIIGGAVGAKPEIVHVPSDFIARFQKSWGDGLLGDKTWSMVFDNSKIKRFVPGFQATISFAEGMRRAAAWYEEDEGRKTVDGEADALIDRIISAYEKGLSEAPE
jgi:nucleoside-diphosphate-sugar epimerase